MQRSPQTRPGQLPSLRDPIWRIPSMVMPIARRLVEMDSVAPSRQRMLERVIDRVNAVGRKIEQMQQSTRV